ncbi:MAG: hypothetical protein DMG27_03110 [Acidobacteria bacterium]|nr:MAG: hypothetical protein DMG27_03110 [Acidobacteriota bacterium]
MATALIVDETFDNILLVRPLYVAVRLGIIRRFGNALLYWPTTAHQAARILLRCRLDSERRSERAYP